jgi:phosphodiesterase/alkaline phosphatase D-like protein
VTRPSLAPLALATAIIAAFAAVPQAAPPVETRPTVVPDVLDPAPFGDEYPLLDGWATGDWWTEARGVPGDGRRGAKAPRPFPIDVPRRDVIAFAVYTVSLEPGATTGVLKLTAQLLPLKPGEPLEARLEVDRGAGWEEIARAPVLYPGWDAHFLVADWDASRTVPYRVCHGNEATFTGSIRRDPADRERVCVAVLSCNSSSTTGPRDELVANLRALDPDLLFFAGDQTYRHTQHTVGWIEFGRQFRDVLRDRPTVTIPDDHDVGHPNLWGASGKRALEKTGSDGGYYYPAAYVNMVQRQQTWHLPDPVDPAPVEQGITIYFTRLVLGGLDLAILEDRKFKTGPKGTIPQLGPRPDHITDPAYDRAAIDLPGLELLGRRQLDWLDRWSRDTRGIRAKAVLSQTAFCGAVHMHGKADERLLADLDCNGWPQSGRNAALRLLRQAGAVHLCGDQHLAVVVQHGIDAFRDGPWAFTAPAIVNTIYGRWWHPENEQPGPNPRADSPLPWTGDYEDGLGNKLTMLAYANPVDPADERQRGDGFGTAVWDFPARTVTFHCVPRFAAVHDGRPEEYPGWPVTVPLDVPWKHAVKDDVSTRFVVPGHDRPMRLLDEMHALHLPGAFIPCTLWDAWLPRSSLWTGPAFRDRYRQAFRGKRIDAAGYVAMQQHRGLAHADGWPFPTWQQGGGAGWHFSVAGDEWGVQAVGLKPLKSWKRFGIEGAEVSGLDPADGLVMTTTAAATTITSPTCSCPAVVCPFVRIEWSVKTPDGSRPRAQLDWQVAGDEGWPPQRSAAIPLTADGGMHYDHVRLPAPTADSAPLTRFRLAVEAQPGTRIALKSLISAVDSRHPNTGSLFVHGASDTFLWTRDVDYLRSVIGPLRQAVRFTLDEFDVRAGHHVRVPWVGHEGTSGCSVASDGTRTVHVGRGVGSNYWDLLPFGGHDAFATLGLWQALGRYESVEQGIDDHPEWAIAAADRPLSPAEIRTLRDAIRRDFQVRFWNADTGRFVGWIDLEGTPQDYGFTFLNTEAVATGIASDAQARSILDWLDGRRLVAGDTAQGSDIYHWRFGPRSTTRRNVETYMWSWARPDSIPWGDQVQDGGGVLGFAAFDLLARLRARSPDDARARLDAILRWFDDVQAEGGYRAFYAKPGRGTLQGGGTAGGLGLDQEFLESILVPQVMLEGFLGFEPGVDDFSVKPRLPAAWPALTVRGIHFHDRVLDVTAKADGTVVVDERPAR